MKRRFKHNVTGEVVKLHIATKWTVFVWNSQSRYMEIDNETLAHDFTEI